MRKLLPFSTQMWSKALRWEGSGPSTKGLCSKHRSSPCIFSGSCIPINPKLSYIRYNYSTCSIKKLIRSQDFSLNTFINKHRFIPRLVFREHMYDVASSAGLSMGFSLRMGIEKKFWRFFRPPDAQGEMLWWRLEYR